VKKFIYVKSLMLSTFFFQAAQSQVLWYGDTNRNYTDSFFRLSKEPGELGNVGTVKDPTNGVVWKVNKPSGSKRTELARTNGFEPKEGDLIYVGWKLKMNIAGNQNPNGMAIFQLKSEGNASQNYPLLIGYNGNSLTFSAYNPGVGSQASRGRVLATKSLKEDVWISIVMGIKFSKDANKGYTELWLDGVKQSLLDDNAEKQAKHRTLDDNGVYFKWGAYNENSRYFNVTAYLDEMRIAKTYALAEPNNYNNVLSISEENVEDTAALSVFPNPNKSGVFKINEKVNWEVHDLLGRIIKKGNSAIIDISNQERGIYIAKIGKNTARKIIFE
jgi:hypothetical protein